MLKTHRYWNQSGKGCLSVIIVLAIVLGGLFIAYKNDKNAQKAMNNLAKNFKIDLPSLMGGGSNKNTPNLFGQMIGKENEEALRKAGVNNPNDLMDKAKQINSPGMLDKTGVNSAQDLLKKMEQK